MLVCKLNACCTDDFYENNTWQEWFAAKKHVKLDAEKQNTSFRIGDGSKYNLNTGLNCQLILSTLSIRNNIQYNSVTGLFTRLYY